jgi:hypothetical protein
MDESTRGLNENEELLRKLKALKSFDPEVREELWNEFEPMFAFHEEIISKVKSGAMSEDEAARLSQQAADFTEEAHKRRMEGEGEVE